VERNAKERTMTDHPYFGLELLYTGLLSLATIAIIVVSVIVILRLFRGQR